MRRVSILLLLVAALTAPGACLAQMRADAAPAPAPAAAAEASIASPDGDLRTRGTRSAFGKVMGVMIAALQRQSVEPARPAAPVRTTTAGTPMGIEVGAAFSDAKSATPPEDSALRQAALAGPH